MAHTPYIPSGDLVFRDPPATGGALVFRLESEGGDPGVVPIRVAALLPGPAVVVHVSLALPVRVALGLAGPEVAVRARYVSGTERPMATQVNARWQDANAQAQRVQQRWQDTSSTPVAIEQRWQDAVHVFRGSAIEWKDAHRTERPAAAVRYQDGAALHVVNRQHLQNAQRAPNALWQRYEDAQPVRRSARQPFQDAIRGIAGQHRTRYQDAIQLQGFVQAIVGSGRAITRGWKTRYQEGVQPLPGRTNLGPVVPPADPCYLPDPALLFSAPWTGSPALLFLCERHGPGPEPGETVVVPIRRIYTVINSASLRRVDGNVHIPTTAMTLSIDVDSWTWGFTARVPGSVLADLEPGGSGPVEVEATINGVSYRAIVEGRTRDRVFGRSDATISGRGKAAVLDAPYSPILTFGNGAADRTVQQLANDVLTLNGVSMGWDVDAGWKPDDWLVPAGAWSFQGSRMAALNAIASAAGAYVQPHRTEMALSVLRRYPVAPWEWGDVVPDFELPAAVVQKEGVTWSDKAIYNRVFVRGMKSGVLGQATRAGTAGDLEAPMVTDQLITAAIGARQRALPVLADVGRQAAVSLRMPVLAATGIIPPGKFVRYVDGGSTRIGLVRSVSAEVQRGSDDTLTIWQTIGVENHVGV